MWMVVRLCYEKSAPQYSIPIVETNEELQQIFGLIVDWGEADAIRRFFRRKEIERTRRLVYAMSSTTDMQYDSFSANSAQEASPGQRFGRRA